MDNTQKGEC